MGMLEFLLTMDADAAFEFLRAVITIISWED